MKKDQIFWVVWAAVVGGALLFQFTYVTGMREENRGTLAKGRYLAARFRPEGSLTRAIQHLMANTPDGKKTSTAEERKTSYSKPSGLEEETMSAIEGCLVKDGYDKRLWKFYPLSQHLKALPSRKKLSDFKGLSQNLAKAREEFVKNQFPKYSFQVDPDLDFKPPAPRESEYIPFRFWVRDQDLETDKAFKKVAGNDIDVTFLEAVLGNRTIPLSWMPDGKVTGWIRDDRDTGGLKGAQEDREKVLRRLLLRRELLLTIARVKVPVAAMTKVGDDKSGGEPAEEVKTQLRGVDRIISLKFIDPPLRNPPKTCYIPHGLEIEVSCHLAVVPALLREIETLGQGRKDRPYTFWADKLLIRRASGWPSAADLSGEIRSESKYGRYNEWPVVVRISGVVPEFTDKNDK